jgi:uncharacterized protein YbaP (TraB family)
MKTAMQELIELIEKGETRLDLIENHKQIWLEKEKEQIKKSFTRGDKNRNIHYTTINSEEYYNQTYNQNK